MNIITRTTMVNVAMVITTTTITDTEMATVEPEDFNVV